MTIPSELRDELSTSEDVVNGSRRKDRTGAESTKTVREKVLRWFRVRYNNARTLKKWLAAKWIEATEAIATVVGVFAACIFFFVEADEREAQSKIRYTIEFINTFQTSELTEARSALLKIYFSKQGVMDVDEALDAVFEEQIRKEVFADPRNYAHLLTILERYSAAIQCVEAGICDLEVMDRYLYRQACTFYAFYGSEIKRLATVLSITELGTRIPSYLSRDRSEIISNNYRCPQVNAPRS